MLENDKKRCFIELGKFLSQFSEEENVKNPTVLHNDLFFEDFQDLIQLSQSHNGWYTPENVYFSIQSWATALTEENLDKWLSAYTLEINEPKNVGLILAGNIPLVGFHDQPQCAAVCPVDCCIPDENHVESEETLLERQAFLHNA